MITSRWPLLAALMTGAGLALLRQEPAIGVAALSLSAVVGALGWLGRQGHATARLSVALERDDMKELRAAIADLPKVLIPRARAAAALETARFHLRIGEPAKSVAVLGPSLAASDPEVKNAALAVRALANATLRDDRQAELDAEEAGELVEAILARAVVQVNRGNTDAAAGLLRRYGALLVDSARPHERALALTLRRSVGLWSPLPHGAAATSPPSGHPMAMLGLERDAPAPPVRSAPPKARRTARPLPLLGFALMVIGALYVGWSALAFPIGACSVFLTFIAVRDGISTRAWSRAIQRARRLQWAGDVEGALETLSREKRSHPALHATAAALLARDARFVEALRECAAGLREPAPDSPHTALLLFTRALCLAATDRIEEARATARALGDVAPLHPLAGAARRSVEIVAAVRGGDILRIEALVKERPVGGAVPMRVEMLADLALARAAVSTDLDHISTLERELDGDPHVRRWTEAVLPPPGERAVATVPYRVASPPTQLEARPDHDPNGGELSDSRRQARTAS